jgi:hypothetical protein
VLVLRCADGAAEPDWARTGTDTDTQRPANNTEAGPSHLRALPNDFQFIVLPRLLTGTSISSSVSFEAAAYFQFIRDSCAALINAGFPPTVWSEEGLACAPLELVSYRHICSSAESHPGRGINCSLVSADRCP